MVFQTKYDVGDEVWFISRNKACKGVIDNICIKITENGIELCHYHINSEHIDNGKTVRTEDYIFNSRNEIIESISNNW